MEQLFLDHDAFLIASPEYNSSVTAVFKNTLDWVSRSAPDEPPLKAFRGKVATLMSASPGALGGIHGLVHARSLLSNMGVIVLSDQLCIGKAHEAIRPDGTLADPNTQAGVEKFGRELASLLEKTQIRARSLIASAANVGRRKDRDETNVHWPQGLPPGRSGPFRRDHRPGRAGRATVASEPLLRGSGRPARRVRARL